MTIYPVESPRRGRKHRFWISHWKPQVWNGRSPQFFTIKSGWFVLRWVTLGNHKTGLDPVSPKNTSPSKCLDDPLTHLTSLEKSSDPIFFQKLSKCLNHSCLGPSTECSACTCKAAGSSLISPFTTSARTQGCDETRKSSKPYCERCLSLIEYWNGCMSPVVLFFVRPVMSWTQWNMTQFLRPGNMTITQWI